MPILDLNIFVRDTQHYVNKPKHMTVDKVYPWIKKSAINITKNRKKNIPTKVRIKEFSKFYKVGKNLR